MQPLTESGTIQKTIEKRDTLDWPDSSKIFCDALLCPCSSTAFIFFQLKKTIMRIIKPKRGSMSIAQAAPELLPSWDQERNGLLAPSEVSYGSNKKIWWNCPKCKESWQAAPITIINNSRKSKSKSSLGCPYCAGKKVSKSSSLAVKCPELASEWDEVRNVGITPYDILPGSGRKVWWICPKGHSYASAPTTRISNDGRGCPVCVGKVVIPETSLATHFPDLSLQWDSKRNGKLTPKDVTPGSNKKIWWLCTQGHNWQAIVNDRANKGYGCPFCSGRSTSLLEMRIYSELKVIFPEVQWRNKLFGFEIDIYLPSLRIGIESDGSYWHKHKEVQDRIKNKAAEKAGLALIRLRERPLSKISEHDIEHTGYGNELMLFHSLLDKIEVIVNNEKVSDSIASYKLASRFLAEDYYRVLSANLPAPPFENSLASNNPTLASEWNYEKNMPLTPEMFLPMSHRKVWWRCSVRGHEYSSAIKDRTQGNGCPYCSGLKVTPENNLATLFPNIAASWDVERNKDLTPSEVVKSSNKMFWWKCDTCGESWKASVDSRTQGRNCPYCAGKKVGKSNSLAVQRPDIAKTWDAGLNSDFTPSDVTAGSKRKAWWRCITCGETWEAPVHRRTQGHDCPYCTGNKIGKSNNLAVRWPEVAATWNYGLNGGITPADVAPASAKKYWWKCDACEESWQTSINSRTSGNNCPFCSGRKVGRFNTLEYKRPDIAKSWAWELNGELTPSKVTLGSHKKAWWKCNTCNGTWLAVVKDRVGKGSGCPHCHRRGKMAKSKI